MAENVTFGVPETDTDIKLETNFGTAESTPAVGLNLMVVIHKLRYLNRPHKLFHQMR